MKPIFDGMKKLATILENQGNMEITYKDMTNSKGTPMFDSILFKHIKKDNVLDINAFEKKTRDSDIRLTGKETYIFPHYHNPIYENYNEGRGYFKKFFLTEIPIEFLNSNVMYLSSKSNSLFDEFDLKNFESENHSVHISKENGDGRFFLGYKGKDSPSFFSFRKLMFENDFIIFCKYFQENRFLIIGAKEDDLMETKLTAKKSELSVCQGSKTKISTSLSILNTKTFKQLDDKQSHQRMFIGAPGIGKSFFVKRESQSNFNDEDITTVTFHPGLKYSQFIGAFKPHLSKEDKTVEYSFHPGLFLSRLVQAVKNPERVFLFTIEEINRGEANAIFGDFFQLLERNTDGYSRYNLDVSPDILDYFTSEDVFEDGKVYLPPNFYLWATCNINDQHTISMDNSFIRRWKRSFIPIDHFESGATFKVTLPGVDKPVAWNKLRRKINDSLMKFSTLQEDQLIGPFFIQSDLDPVEFFSDIVIHLKENVLQELSSKMFTHTFASPLYDSFMKGEQIFKDFSWDDLTDE